MERLERASDAEIWAFLARSAAGRATADDAVVHALCARMPGLLAEWLALTPDRRVRFLASLPPSVTAPSEADAPAANATSLHGF